MASLANHPGERIENLPPALFVIAGTYLLFVAGLYFSSFRVMVSWWKLDDYTYCYLIPFLIAYVIWGKRGLLLRSPFSSSWLGLLPLLFGILLFLVGQLGGEFYTIYLSAWLVSAGLCWMHLGWKKIKVVGFAFLLTLTLFPLPNFLYRGISVRLQLVSSKLGVALMQLWGLPAFREGNVIDMGFTKLQVVDACNGLRYLIPLLVLSLVVVYFFRARFWKRALLVFSAIPLSILMNSLRIGLTGILYKSLGPEAAEGFFHSFSGWLVFMISLGVLLLEMVVLGKIGSKSQKSGVPSEIEKQRHFTGQASVESQESRENQRAEIGDLRSEEDRGKKEDRWRSKEESGRGRHKDRDQKSEIRDPGSANGEANRFLSDYSSGSFRHPTSDIRLPKSSILRSLLEPHFLVAVLLLGAMLIFSRTINFREKIPSTRPFSEFPISVDNWVGERQPMAPEFINGLHLTDYAIINYRNRTDKSVNFYVAYYASQRKGKSIHSPATCLPGSGWVFKDAGDRKIPLMSGKSMEVNRAVMENMGEKELAYYWFPQRGRILTNAYELKIYNFWDALTKHRTDGALVRLITPIYDTGNVADADRRLTKFTQEIVPILDTFIPGKNVSPPARRASLEAQRSQRKAKVRWDAKAALP